MRRIIGLLLFILDLAMLPAFGMYYVLLVLDLLCGCKATKADVKAELIDFNDIVKVTIENRIDDHKCRIFGA